MTNGDIIVTGNDFCTKLASMKTMDIDPSKTQQYRDLLARQIEMEKTFKEEIKSVKQQVAEEKEILEEAKCKVDNLGGKFEGFL